VLLRKLNVRARGWTDNPGACSKPAATACFASGYSYLPCLKSLSINPRIRSRDSALIGVLASKVSNCIF
jgi:hypothetical protein